MSEISTVGFKNGNKIDSYLRIETENYDRPELFVIGTGLMRTGTMSLKVALEILYGKECFHMTTLWLKPKYINMWTRAFLEIKSDSEWRLMLKDFCAAVDIPTIVFYKRIFEIYPNVKLILTVRDPYCWAESIQDTIKKHLDFTNCWYIKFVYFFKGISHIPYITMCSIRSTLGDNINWDDKEELVIRYKSWVTQVINSVPRDKLLIFDVKEGWTPLCKFLDCAEPKEIFPNVNDKNTFNKRLIEHKKGIIYQTGFIFLLALIGLFVLLFPV